MTTVTLGMTRGASASAPSAPPFIVADNCLEHQAFLDGDRAAVAARVPRGYSALTDPRTGRPLLFARAERCDVTIAGATAPAIAASFGIVIHSPDGMGCDSGAPGAGQTKGDAIPYCNWYPLFWLSNDRRVVDWLRSGTPDYPAYYAPDLTLSEGPTDPVAGTPFHFQVPAPAPSPFSMDDTGHPGPSTISVRGGYWRSTKEGSVKLTFSTDDITPGSASDGVVRAQPGSEMAQLMGSPEQPYSAFYATQIGAEHWEHGSYRKQILGPAPTTHRFSGSCSLQGTDYFTPAASNTPQQLRLNYDAVGTCTGKLDRHSINNAPVKMTTTAQPYGSCSQARTLAPGTGSITFADGTTIDLTYDFTSLGTEVDGTYYGQRWGYARVHATFATQRTGPDVIVNCAGNGASRAPMDLMLTTVTTLMSQSSGVPSGGGGRRRPALRLIVRPRTVTLGHRVRFSFRVMTAAGGSVAGATIRLGDRRIRSAANGRAAIVATIRNQLRIVARATKPGWRSAQVTIRVHRRRPDRRTASSFTG